MTEHEQEKLTSALAGSRQAADALGAEKERMVAEIADLRAQLEAATGHLARARQIAEANAHQADQMRDLAERATDRLAAAEKRAAEAETRANHLRACWDACDDRASEASDIIRELRQKLAEAGVEGSPPPGADATIGSLRARCKELEESLRRADEAADEARASREIIANLRVALAMAGRTPPGAK